MSTQAKDTAPSPLPKVAKQLIVFDFDWSLADQDTDRYVHEVLSPRLRAKLKQLKSSVQFTDLCSQLLVELHEVEGKSKDDVLNALRMLPMHPGMMRGVKALKQSANVDTTFFLLSNSNQVYIDTILEHHNLLPPAFELFTEIVTNPATWSPSGCLQLSRRIPASSPNQHACSVGCSPNMCKGDELEAFLSRHGGRQAFDRIIYVGDGGNDYCPVLRLGANDLALVRRYRGLETRIAREGNVKAGIRYWAGAWEVEGILGELRGEPRLA
ncbi:uncharacterized protein PFL1_03081 [Pseudozyma flocculosa PF-1]|uniref:Pyridoxal phosphate phosphatase phospho2 n=2 Tax=Pseudozyma flocculosa TaxID=84751 RepID=A0A5C3F0N4_9BASI|nr:uncharacterized protein PFL1_03081 [Pseudozyma flocculosa PF-1]EPQ29326.1 hypothetical protein PFL1_03081 [Pseudozyma flocculosa PF-1]SPO37842.1 uncharacterized protein PSFLO_03319 [Pseudozyma flocculosa]